MKGFIVLLYCVGTALSAPQYNYNPPNQVAGPTGPAAGGEDILGGGLLDVRSASIGAGPSFAPSTFGGGNQIQQGHSAHSNYRSGHIGVGAPNFGQVGQIGGSRYSQRFSSNSGSVGGGFGGNFGGGFGGGNGYSSHGSAGGHQTIVTKQFFIHSAPEEQDAVGGDKVINLGPGRKHYRVVFIKAPHQSVQGGRVRFVAPANEEKTVIYVLSKKTDLADIAADVQQAHSEPTKPEVHFIKYKTQEEALHAQRTIQSQYDQLGGTSQISDEGFAPISSVIGALGHAEAGAGHGGAQHVSQGGFTNSGSSGFGASFGSTGSASVSGISGSSATYLPPSH